VYHLCVARVADRDAFRRSLPFDTGVHYPRALTGQPAYASFTREPCPEAERWAAECVSFPCFPEMTDDEIEVVCRAIR
jgi:dTDP-4-amino-4,6-dideoxygalactose transaminase